MVKLFHKWVCIQAMMMLAAGAAWAGGGDAAARSFAEYCAGTLPADRTTRFYSELDNADRALGAGDRATAETSLGKAWEAAFRGGGETDVGVRCLGETATRRWYNTRLSLWRMGSSAGLGGGMGRDYTTLYVAAADRGTDGILQVIENRPADNFVWAYHSVEDIVERDQWMREFGALILPEETKAVEAARAALPKLQAYAKREHAATLVAEDKSFNRPATEQERAAANQMAQIGKLAESMAGVDTGSADQQELMLTNRQVDESRALLEKARGLEVAPVFGYFDDQRRMPSSIRAEQRGDELMARGDDESRSLEFRNDLYDLSIKYYSWCKCRDKRAALARAQGAIQPALIAERERKQEKAEKMSAEMQQNAEAMQKSIDDMQKTEAEKKSFQDEADDLEAELGF